MEEQAKKWEKKAEWLDEARRGPRWCDVRTALTRFDNDEYLGKMCDVSLGGLAVNVNDTRVPQGQDVSVAVVFDDRVVQVKGRVAYSLAREGGSLIGVSVPDLTAETRDYLIKRYGGSAGEPAVT